MSPREAYNLIKKKFPELKLKKTCSVADDKIIFYVDLGIDESRPGMRHCGPAMYLFDARTTDFKQFIPSDDFELWQKVKDVTL